MNVVYIVKLKVVTDLERRHIIVYIGGTNMLKRCLRKNTIFNLFAMNVMLTALLIVMRIEFISGINNARDMVKMLC